MLGINLGLNNRTRISGGTPLPSPLCLMPLEDDLSIPIGTGSATFTRTGPVSTFRAPVTDVLTSAIADVARFETNGLLMEAASTNLLPRAEEHDNAAWSKQNLTLNVNAIVAPDGNTTADTLVETSAASTQFRANQAVAGLTATNIYTFSAFTKPAGRDWSTLNAGTSFAKAWFDTTNGTIGTILSGVAALDLFNNGFYRCSVAGAAPTTTETMRLQNASANTVETYTGDGASGNTFWGSSLEELAFASSYIPTAGIAVTRGSDNLTIDAANISAPANDYSVSMRVDAIGFDSNLSQVLFNVVGETGTRKIEWDTTTGAIKATHGAVTSVSTSTFNPGDRVDVSFAVDAVNQTLYINGIQEDQDAKGTVTGTATGINICHEAGANQAFSHIRPLRIDDSALTLQQATQLTAAA